MAAMASASMSCPRDRVCRARDLRIRPVPELGHCLVFTPSRPMLYALNPPAWLLLELCAGQRRDRLTAQFREAFDEADLGARDAPAVDGLIEDLERKGIVYITSEEEEEA